MYDRFSSITDERRLDDESEQIRILASQITGLPALPLIASHLLEAVDNPETSAAEMAALISSDPALATRLLKLANSAFYGFPRRIGTVNLAVVVLGFETVRDLCLSVIIADCFFQDENKLPFEMEAFWRHSITSAVAARMIYKMSGANHSGEGFIAGLVHDVGKLFLARYFPKKYAAVLKMVRVRDLPLLEAEKESFSATHSAAGAWLLDEWNLPLWLVDAVKYHHLPDDNNTSKLALSVSFADVMVRKLSDQEKLCGVQTEVTTNMLDVLKLKQDEEGEPNYQYYFDLLKEELARSEGFVNTIRKPEHNGAI